MDGIILKDDLTEIQNCITDVEGLEKYVDAAVEDFKEGSLAGYSEACMQIQQLILNLPERVTTCENIHDDLTKLQQWASIFLAPSVFFKTVSKNLLWNYGTIHQDVTEAINDYDTNQYFNFGDMCGEILIIATKQWEI